VVGGPALILLIAAFSLFRWRRQNKADAASGRNNPTPAPFPFVVEEPEKVDEPADILTDSPPSPSPASPALQSAAVRHYGDMHTVPDVIAQTQQGLRLSPQRGAGSTSNVSSSSSVPAALVDMKREQAAAVPHYGDNHTAPDSVTRTDAGVQLVPGRPPGAQAPNPPAAATSDPVLQELQSLRKEVRRLTAERRSDAPPSYDGHGD